MSQADTGRVDARGMRWVANVSEATGERAATDGWVAYSACRVAIPDRCRRHGVERLKLPWRHGPRALQPATLPHLTLPHALTLPHPPTMAHPSPPLTTPQVLGLSAVPLLFVTHCSEDCTADSLLHGMQAPQYVPCMCRRHSIPQHVPCMRHAAPRAVITHHAHTTHTPRTHHAHTTRTPRTHHAHTSSLPHTHHAADVACCRPARMVR